MKKCEINNKYIKHLKNSPFITKMYNFCCQVAEAFTDVDNTEVFLLDDYINRSIIKQSGIRKVKYFTKAQTQWPLCQGSKYTGFI